MKKNKPTPKQNKWKDPHFKRAMRDRMGYYSDTYKGMCKKMGVEP